MPKSHLPLTVALREINAQGATLTYQQLWNAVGAGRIPAVRVGQRWMIREADLPAIAQTLTNA